LLTVNVDPLFTPFRLAGSTLPNRFVLPGMQRGWCEAGAPSAQLGDYYRRRVEAGVGLIITESVAVDDPSATQDELFARMADDTFEAWQACIASVKQAGGHIILQLWHEGAVRTEGGEGPWSHFPTISPSGLVCEGVRNGRAATLEEIEAIRDAFVRSARLAMAAGADGVEVHGAHGYLLDQFLWPVTNQRDDHYGGEDMQNRVRLIAEIVSGIREACGPDFAISVRFSQWKEADFGAKIARSPAELGVMLVALREAGADILHASTRRFWEPEWPDSDLSLAGWARKLSGLPVITVGSVGLSSDITDTFRGSEATGRTEESLRGLTARFDAGEFDLVSIGRSLIGDPDWVEKVRTSDFAAIRTFERSDLELPDIGLGSFGDGAELGSGLETPPASAS
jgi:2,4-dienoyl-CoA reductase-like NADH-dependent reductase (Old Yellow Enzyme family)